MKKYIGKRIISFLIVLVGVSILSFLLIAWSGKDPAEIIAHRGVSNPTPEQIEMIRVEMGLDQPLPVRYIQWLSGMFTGELGTSLTTHQPIVKDLHKYLATTTSLVGMAILWIIVLTVPISLLCARKRNRLFDQVTRGITICGICVPTFWLGFLLLLFFAIHLKWFSVLPSPGWRGFLSYAVNQQELETSVFDGLETAAETLFTNEKPNCGVEVKTYPTDMEKAKQLMKEAGYEDTNDDGILEKDGTSLAIHFNYSQSLASVDNAVLSIAASLKELGFDVTIDAVDMNTWYGALMAGEYDLTFYNTAGGSFDPATDMSNMAPGAMGDPILCQFSAFFENPEIFAELDSTSDSQRVQEIYGMILNGIADQNLLVPVTGTHDLALWNTDKITGYDFYTDASYVDIASVHVK